MASISAAMITGTTTPRTIMVPLRTPTAVNTKGGFAMVIECSSRPKKKATSHHMKTRPKKTQAWDIRRKGPTLYPPLPPLPPDWTLVSSTVDSPQPQEDVSVAASPSPPISP